MNDTLFKQTFDASIKMLSALAEELKALDERREQINAQIIHVRNTALAVSPLIGEDPEKKYPELFPDLIPSDIGLTDAVRRVLQNTASASSPKVVRLRLERIGFDTSKYGNILASIHTILKRLVESGEVEVVTIEGRALYKWKRPKPGIGGDPKPISEIQLPRIKQAPAQSKGMSEGLNRVLKKVAENLNTEDKEKK